MKSPFFFSLFELFVSIDCTKHDLIITSISIIEMQFQSNDKRKLFTNSKEENTLLFQTERIKYRERKWCTKVKSKEKQVQINGKKRNRQQNKHTIRPEIQPTSDYNLRLMNRIKIKANQIKQPTCHFYLPIAFPVEKSLCVFLFSFFVWKGLRVSWARIDCTKNGKRKNELSVNGEITVTITVLRTDTQNVLLNTFYPLFLPFILFLLWDSHYESY